MILSRKPALLAGLLLLDIAAAGLLAGAIFTEITPPPAPVAMPDEPMLDLPGPSPGNFDDARRRPIFLASRRPWTPPPAPTPAAPVTAPAPPPALRLQGIMTAGAAGARAYVATEGQPGVRSVQAGDEIEGWRVLEIGAAELILGLGERKITMTMDEGGARGARQGNGERAAARTRQARPPQP